MITDEIILFEDTAVPVIAFETSDWNIKVTTKKDLSFLEEHLRREVRVGVGEDAHLFDITGTLVLGGVKIPGLPKLKANSDGDVILHVLCNALRSAMGEGSFSKIADPLCARGIRDSKIYLKNILPTDWMIANLSISLTCIEPKIDPLVPKMKRHLSKLLDISKHQIGITATTGSALKSGIACTCMVTLHR